MKAWGDDGLFQSAHSVTVDRQGFFWVTDSTGHVVHKLSPDGKLLMTLGKKGSAGDNTSRDMFNQPNHVAIAPNGDIYVSDGYQNSRVVHFSGNGQFVRIIGGVRGSAPGQLQVPHGVALDSRGRILVNDSDNERVSVFDKDGKFVESWPFPSRGGIEVTADDTVYVSDVNAGIVNIVRNGNLSRQRFRRQGSRSGRGYRWFDLRLRSFEDDGDEDHPSTVMLKSLILSARFQ